MSKAAAVRLVPIDSVSADPANLRLHGERSTAAMVGSLRRFGQQKPIVIDSRGVVVAGNNTLEAARHLGWKHVMVIRSALEGVERVAYAIADNRIGELSEWDETGLVRTLAEMDEELRGLTGFDAADLEALAGESAEEDDGPPAPLPTAVSQRGDLWELGRHLLLCGDSTQLADVERVMDGAKAALVATDPPYLVDYTGDRPDSSGKDWSGVYHEVDIKDAETFFRCLFTNVLKVLGPRGAIYTWHAHRRCGLIQQIWNELGILDHQQIIWVKPSPVFGRVYWHFQHEPCIMGWGKGSQPEHDDNHEYTSVWELDWEGKGKVIGNEHPTQKPVEIFARPMRKHTKPGDVVYEPFSGSGSQLVAAEQLGRSCRAIEIEPVFVDVGIRRWQTLTGQAARLAGDGRTWDQVALERGMPCPPALSANAASPDVPSSPSALTAKNTRSKSAKREPGQRSKGRPRAGVTEPTGDN